MSLKSKWNQRVRDYCNATYSPITVKPGKIHFNYRCHLNAVHYALKKGDSKIAMVTYREDVCVRPCVHFVNYHKGKFIDNTIGYWADTHKYQFIRWVEKDEWSQISTLLGDAQKKFTDMATFIEKLFGGI